MSELEQQEMEEAGLENDAVAPEPDEELEDGLAPYDDELGDEQARREGVNTQAELEREAAEAARRLELEAQRHQRRVFELMGEESVHLVQCVLCNPLFPGWRFDVPLAEEHREIVKVAIGLGDLSQYEADTFSMECQRCKGLGVVRSGSHVNGQQTLRCLGCDGNGWVANGPERAKQAAQAQAAPASGNTPPDVGSLPDVDPWGTPAGHPDYGKSPPYRQFPLPVPPAEFVTTG